MYCKSSSTEATDYNKNLSWVQVYFGGVQSALLEATEDPVLVALREGVQWRDSLEQILEDVVAGHLATWDNSITTRLLVAVRSGLHIHSLCLMIFNVVPCSGHAEIIGAFN